MYQEFVNCVVDLKDQQAKQEQVEDLYLMIYSYEKRLLLFLIIFIEDGVGGAELTTNAIMQFKELSVILKLLVYIVQK